MHKHSNATYSAALTEGENAFCAHMRRFGTAGYPVTKLGKKWAFERAFGAGGSPILYPTKGKAVQAVTAYLEILRDKAAGRLEPSPGSPAYLDALDVQRIGTCDLCGNVHRNPGNSWHCPDTGEP